MMLWNRGIELAEIRPDHFGGKKHEHEEDHEGAQRGQETISANLRITLV